MSLIGRSRELEALAAAPGPLVVLWGEAGVGKTALALAFARRAADEGVPVALVDLAGARSERELRVAVAAEVADEGGAEPPSTTELAGLVRGVAVLDGAESLDADARAALIALASCSRDCKLIVTTRDVIAGATETRVPPLAPEDALALLSRAAGEDVSVTVGASIASRLGHNPLAIVLAGARVPVLGAEGLARELEHMLDLLATRDAPDARHASLRAAIAGSWEILSDDDRAVLEAVSVAASSFDVDLAEACSAAPRLVVIDALDRARRLALVTRVEDEGPARLEMSEPVRDFARERLAARADPDAVRARHARAVLDAAFPLAERVMLGADAAPELASLRPDLVTISRSPSLPPRDRARALVALAALALATSPSEAPWRTLVETREELGAEDADEALALHLVHATLSRATGDLASAASSSREALARAAPRGERERTDAARIAASVARSDGDLPVARARAEEALSRARALGDPARVGLACTELGSVSQSEGSLSRAIELHAEAVAWLASAGCHRAEGLARSQLAVATHRRGDVDAAVPLHEKVLAAHREVGHARLAGAELLHLAFAHHERGDPDTSRACFAEATAILAAVGARGLEALAHALRARLEVDEGELTKAALSLGEARRAAPPTWSRVEATARVVEGHLAMAGRDPARAAAAYDEALARSSSVEVGFEALTPAYAALAHARAGDASRVEPLLSLARERVSAFENPHLAVAREILAAAARGAAFVEPPAPSRASSSEIRRALAFAGEAGSHELRVERDARVITLADGRSVDLGRRRTLWSVFDALLEARLARPGVPVPPAALVEAGWPGERMREEAATKRLHTAIWSLRRAGLEGILVTSDEGYHLDPRVAVDASSPFERV